MTLAREPRIRPVAIAALRPTQITVVADLRRLPRDAFWCGPIVEQ